MELVLLAYGAAFVAMACALGVQARAAAPPDPIPPWGLWALMLFALLHGVADWGQLGLYLVERDGAPLPIAFALVRLALLATSFAMLGSFGLLLAIRRPGRARSRLATGIPLAALLACAAAIVSRRAGKPLDRPAIEAAEAATRYLLCLPACVAAIVGLARVGRRTRAEEWRASRYLGGAALATAAYGFFAGLVVPESPLGLAPHLNLSSFVSVARIPVELFRAASIGAVGLLVSEVFIATTSRHLRSEVEHLRDDFISLVAHDLRSPLHTIVTGTALLEALPRDQHGTEREARALRAIRSSTRAMGKIVNDLLDASRVERAGLSVSPEPFDLGPTLLRLVEWAPAEALRGHTVRLEPPGPLPPVLADPVRAEQVLTNLLSNAGKYSPPRTEIVLQARADPAEVTLSVTNAGPGIPARDLPRIFSRHYRTRAARAGRAPGLGLGLFISKGLVEAQGGRIWAESDVGRRTTFSFTLPRAPERRASADREARQTEPASSR